MFTSTPFTDFELSPSIYNGLSDLGWEFATQVQKDTIPTARSGRDLIGQARTGS